jgi:NTP pyrophosphatase (non-canonical NTP hydrolase)
VNDQQTTVAEIKQRVLAFVDARDWRQFHDPKNLAMSIAIETAELMEHFQWLRSDQLATVRDDPQHMAGIREELADLVIYAISFANALGIDVSAAIDEKLQRNEVKYPAEKYRGRFR